MGDTQVDLILSRPDIFPAVTTEPDRVIRCSPTNVDRVITRTMPRAKVLGELWHFCGDEIDVSCVSTSRAAGRSMSRSRGSSHGAPSSAGSAVIVSC
jgi:hypothetical protein